MIALLLLAGVSADPADYYVTQTVPIPEEAYLEVGALRLIPATGELPRRLAVASRRGEIWMLHDPLSDAAAGEGAKPKWVRYAHGLHEVLGLAWKDGWLYATQRPEVTRMRDADGDGRADLFETVADGWGVSGDYHEYAFGTDFLPETSPYAGEIWVSLCLTGSFGSKVPFRGWTVRVTPDGKTIPVVSGVRSPGGTAFNAAGDVFYSENQGPWNGACAVKHLRPKKFVGHPGGFEWFKLTDELGEKPQEPQNESRMHVEADKIPELEPPAVLFPYDRMGKSTAGFVFDTTGGEFGPWTMPDGTGQAYVCDQSYSTVMRMTLEKVKDSEGDEHYQGACLPMLEGYDSGNLAVELAADGSLFVGGTNRGWGSRGRQPYALQRTRWTGVVPPAINWVSATPTGFRLNFTKDVGDSALDPAAYEAEAWTYIYQASYGSPEVDGWTPQVTGVKRVDAKTVELTLDKLDRGFVYRVAAPGVKTAGGEGLWQPTAYYTLNYVPAG